MGQPLPTTCTLTINSASTYLTNGKLAIVYSREYDGAFKLAD